MISLVMGHPLEGVKLKVARAAEHMDVLATESAAYMDSEPYEVVGETRPDGHTRLVARVHRDLPPRLGVLLGDLLYDLRSSLDHLAWQLVLANGGTPRGDRGGTQFPILGRRRAGPIRIAGGVCADVARLVEELQPYNNASGTPRKHPLFVLSTLNNVDKHRQLNIAVLTVSEMMQADLMTADGTGIYMTFQVLDALGSEKPVTNGAVIGRTPFPASPGQGWRVRFDSTLGIQESEGTGLGGSLPLYPTAERLLGFVRDDVVPNFARLFDQDDT